MPKYINYSFLETFLDLSLGRARKQLRMGERPSDQGQGFTK